MATRTLIGRYCECRLIDSGEQDVLEIACGTEVIGHAVYWPEMKQWAIGMCHGVCMTSDYIANIMNELLRWQRKQGSKEKTA